MCVVVIVIFVGSRHVHCRTENIQKDRWLATVLPFQVVSQACSASTVCVQDNKLNFATNTITDHIAYSFDVRNNHNSLRTVFIVYQRVLFPTVNPSKHDSLLEYRVQRLNNIGTSLSGCCAS